jgi:hypothetical protein
MQSSIMSAMDWMSFGSLVLTNSRRNCSKLLQISMILMVLTMAPTLNSFTTQLMQRLSLNSLMALACTSSGDPSPPLLSSSNSLPSTSSWLSGLSTTMGKPRRSQWFSGHQIKPRTLSPLLTSFLRYLPVYLWSLMERPLTISLRNALLSVVLRL